MTVVVVMAVTVVVVMAVTVVVTAGLTVGIIPQLDFLVCYRQIYGIVSLDIGRFKNSYHLI